MVVVALRSLGALLGADWCLVTLRDSQILASSVLIQVLVHDLPITYRQSFGGLIDCIASTVEFHGSAVIVS